MTATVIPETDVSVLEEMLEQLQPPCEFYDYPTVRGHVTRAGSHPCGQAAAWVIHTRFPCGTAGSALACDRHHDNLIQPGILLACTRCWRAERPDEITAERL